MSEKMPVKHLVRNTRTLSVEDILIIRSIDITVLGLHFLCLYYGVGLLERTAIYGFDA